MNLSQLSAPGCCFATRTSVIARQGGKGLSQKTMEGKGNEQVKKHQTMLVDNSLNSHYILYNGLFEQDLSPLACSVPFLDEFRNAFCLCSVHECLQSVCIDELSKLAGCVFH